MHQGARKRMRTPPAGEGRPPSPFEGRWTEGPDEGWPRFDQKSSRSSEAASRDGVVFEAQRGTRSQEFGGPTTGLRDPPQFRDVRALPRAPSFLRTRRGLRISRSSAPGILPISPSRHSLSGAPSPSRCRREPTPILSDRALCQALPSSYPRSILERQAKFPCRADFVTVLDNAPSGSRN